MSLGNTAMRQRILGSHTPPCHRQHGGGGGGVAAARCTALRAPQTLVPAVLRSPLLKGALDSATTCAVVCRRVEVTAMGQIAVQVSIASYKRMQEERGCHDTLPHLSSRKGTALPGHAVRRHLSGGASAGCAPNPLLFGLVSETRPRSTLQSRPETRRAIDPIRPTATAAEHGTDPALRWRQHRTGVMRGRPRGFRPPPPPPTTTNSPSRTIPSLILLGGCPGPSNSRAPPHKLRGRQAPAMCRIEACIQLSHAALTHTKAPGLQAATHEFPGPHPSYCSPFPRRLSAVPRSSGEEEEAVVKTTDAGGARGSAPQQTPLLRCAVALMRPDSIVHDRNTA